MRESKPKKRKLSHTLDTSSLNEMGSEQISRPSEGEQEVHGTKNGKLPKREGSSQHRPESDIRKDKLNLLKESVDPSSMLDRQVNGLLDPKGRDDKAVREQVKDDFTRMRPVIFSIPQVKALSAPEAVKDLKAKGVRIPFPKPIPNQETKYQFEYRHPEKVELIDSEHFRQDSNECYTVDIVILMPADLFQEKDFLNCRYFHKRAYYLAQIAAGMQIGFGRDIHFEYQDGVLLKPTLVFGALDDSSSNPLSARIQYRIICGIDQACFPQPKTLPKKCCLRFGGNTDPTPFYNAALRADASVFLNRDILTKATPQCKAFNEVCRLGHLWLSSRDLGSEITKGGFGAFEWSLICATLLQATVHGQSLLSTRHSSLLLFKGMLRFLVGQDLIVSPFLNGLRDRDNPGGVPLFFERTTQMNVLYKMSQWSYRLLQEEARASLEIFNSKSLHAFDMIFFQNPQHCLSTYDETYLVEVDLGLESHRLHLKNVPAASLYRNLNRALGSRVKRIHLAQSAPATWLIDKPSKSHQALNQIRIGLMLDPGFATRLVEHGPSVEKKAAAAEFRGFWGDKSEVRRFKDGSTTETLIWREGTPVTHQILSHITPRTFKDKSCSIQFLGHRVEAVLDDPDMRSRSGAFRFTNTSFQSLSNSIRQLQGLPLSIHSILPASPQLRSSSFGTRLTSNPPEPVDIQIVFEGSSRWPDSLAAMQRSKLAFLLKLGDLLSASNPQILTRIGLENTEDPTTPYFNPGYLDILFPYPPIPTPLPFRLRIHHPQTGNLLRSLLPTLPGPQKPVLQAALHSHARATAISPHTSTISRLCTRLPSLSTALYLLHSWIASHHLSNQIPAEALDIICAYPYLHPHPYPYPPTTGQTAFLRTLDLLTKWDWVHEPLVVDLSAATSSPSGDPDAKPGPTIQNLRTQANTRLLSWREHLDPSLQNVVWLLATSLDETGVVWTQSARPSRLVAGRVSDLARASLSVVRDRSAIQSGEKEPESQNEIGLGVRREWKELFTSRLADFDFLIRLHDPAGIVERAAEEGQDESWAGVGFDPIGVFLADLERLFSPAVIMFFHGHGKRVVGGVWNPKALAGGEWRVKMGYSSVPVAVGGDKGDAVRGKINQEGILSEIEALGQGIVKKIEVVKPLLET